MARLTIHTAQSAPEAVRPALSAAEQGAGYLSNLLGVLANAPAALEAYQTLSQINARAGLTLQEREVVQLVAGTRHGCTFCVAGHTALARNKAKLSPEVVEALRAQGTLPDARLQALAAFTEAVINTRGRVSDAELQALREVGYTDGNALEVIVGVGLATICNFGNNRRRRRSTRNWPTTPGAPSNDGDAGAYRYRRPFPAAGRAARLAGRACPGAGRRRRGSRLGPAQAGRGRRVPAGRARQPGRPEGSDAGDAIEAVSQLAEHSVAAAFVAWGQRVFIEYLLHSPNQALARDWTGPLLRGELAGATALSNAMKFLSGIESLQISARQTATTGCWTAACPGSPICARTASVAAAVTAPDGTPAVVALPQGIAGLTRSADLRLLGLQSSNTAALEVKGVRISPRWLIHADARQYLPQARPAFAGLQCGSSIGLARRALRQPRRRAGQGARGILAEPLAQLQAQVEYLSDQLIAGVREGRRGRALAAVRGPHRAGRGGAAGGAAGAAGRRRGLPEAGRRWLRAALARGRLPAHRHAQPVQLKTELAKRRAGWPPRRRHERRHERPRAGAARARSDAALSGRRRRRVPGREPGPARGEVLAVLGAGPASPACCACWPGCRRPAPARSTWKASGWPACIRAWPWRSGSGLLPWLTLERNVAFGLTSSISRRWMRARRAARGPPSRKSACRTPASCGRPSCPAAWRSAPRWRCPRQPAVLLLDEPFGALDEVTRAEMQTLLRKVVADVGAAALLITHDIDEALLLADRMVLLGGARRRAGRMGRGPAAARRPAARNGRAGNTVRLRGAPDAASEPAVPV